MQNRPFFSICTEVTNRAETIIRTIISIEEQIFLNFEFIINSQEFKQFSRPQGDVEKLLNSLPKLTTFEIVDRMRSGLKIEEHVYNPLQKDEFDRTCKEFQTYSK